jgi:hypothetical protein
MILQNGHFPFKLRTRFYSIDPYLSMLDIDQRDIQLFRFKSDNARYYIMVI